MRKDNIFNFIVRDDNFYLGYIRRNFMLMILFRFLWREVLTVYMSKICFWKVIKFFVGSIMGLVCRWG